MTDCRTILYFISTKILRKRLVLFGIFLFSLTYFTISTFPGLNLFTGLVISTNTHTTHEIMKDIDIFKLSPKYNERNSSKVCRNSVQGLILLADEYGYVCDRKDLSIRGCCNPQGSSTKHYFCETCIDNDCCNVYEHCVSCCLQPEKQPLLRKILGKASDSFNNLFASVTDHFELCLAKCRTSSQSVQHENSYRDPKAKYCFGEHPPSLNN